MRLFASETVAMAQAELGQRGLTDRLHYCYRCYSCGRLITKVEIINSRSRGEMNLCSCGSRKVQPANAHWWQELFLPRCWKLIYALRKKLIAPAPAPLTPQEQEEADRVARAALRAFEGQQIELAGQIKRA